MSLYKVNVLAQPPHLFVLNIAMCIQRFFDSRQQAEAWADDFLALQGGLWFVNSAYYGGWNRGFSDTGWVWISKVDEP